MSLSTMVGQIPGVTAAADLSAKQYYMVTLASETTCNVAGAGEVAAGILINEPESGDACDIFSHGEGEVKVAAALVINSPFKSDASGLAVLADTDTDHIVGWTRSAATAAGDVVKCLVAPGSLSV